MKGDDVDGIATQIAFWLRDGKSTEEERHAS